MSSVYGEWNDRVYAEPKLKAISKRRILLAATIYSLTHTPLTHSIHSLTHSIIFGEIYCPGNCSPCPPHDPHACCFAQLLVLAYSYIIDGREMRLHLYIHIEIDAICFGSERLWVYPSLPQIVTL